MVDTSAIVAILRLEPEADAFLETIARTEASLISAVSVLEAGIVLAGARLRPVAFQRVHELLDRARIVTVPFDGPQAERAGEASLRFGKGRHPASLNICDCAAYALASVRGLPLLFKGRDFSRTDLPAAI